MPAARLLPPFASTRRRLFSDEPGWRLYRLLIRSSSGPLPILGLHFKHDKIENRTGDLDRPLDPASVYQNIVRKYGLETGISAQVNGLCVHSLRATAATNA